MFGFVRHPDGTVHTMAALDDALAAADTEGAAMWVDLEAPAEVDLRRLEAAFKLDAESIHDCLSGEQRPRIDEFDHYILLVLYGLVGAGGDEEVGPRKLVVFCGARFLITVHPESLRTTEAVRHRCERSAGQMLAQGVDFVLYCILDGMVDKYSVIVERYEDRLEAIEEASFDPEEDESFLAEAATLRHELLDLRRLAVSQREVVRPLAKGEYDHVSENLARRFSHVADHLTQVIELTDVLRERLLTVRDNYHTTLASRTNDIMKTLTLIATILLPLTFVAGIYGMNLPLWPPSDNPLSFWGVMAFMAALAVGFVVYFRRKKWI